MSQPRAYTRQANFTDHTTESPSDPQVGSKLDSEFDALNLTLNDIRTNLAVLQRDDTKVANSSIHTEALSNAVLALIKATENGYGIKGSWLASTAYILGDLVESSKATYLCHTAHTSGSLLTEEEIASYWILLANAAIVSGASAVDTFNGNGALLAFTLVENTPTGVTDVLVFVNGSLQIPTTDYTVTSTTLTFVHTAPSSGTKNVIVWGTNTAVEAAKAATLSARDLAEAHRDDASQHKQTAERWANLEDATVTDVDTGVDSLEYSAKEYAIGDTPPTGSAKEWSTNAGSAEVATGAGYSSKAYAQDTGNDIGSARDWAILATQVSSTDYSSRQYAVGTPPDGSAKEWATEENAVVSDSEFSAKEYAQGVSAGVTTGGSSKDWAIYEATTVRGGGGDYSAKVYAADTALAADTTGGSAKGWSQTAASTDVPGAAVGTRSALHYSAAAETAKTAAEDARDLAQSYSLSTAQVAALAVALG